MSTTLVLTPLIIIHWKGFSSNAFNNIVDIVLYNVVGGAIRIGSPENISSAILDAAALGFLGLGVQPPTPEWGTMLASARDYIERAWWVVSLPGLTILLSVLAINLMGDGLRDALDPKLKNAA